VQLDWGDRMRQELGTLANRKMIADGTLEERINNIVNRPEYEVYLKRLKKIDEPNKA